MMHVKKLIFAAGVVTFAGCAHLVTDDYGQYLQNNAGTFTFQHANVANQYFLTPRTRTHHYEFRAFAAGAANRWVVEFGKVLDATMQSADVVAALGSLTPVNETEANHGSTIVFDLRQYQFEGYQAHVGLNISIKRDGNEIFQKGYVAEGRSQGGKAFVGGAFAMKNAVQQSTKSAVDKILAEFIADAKNLPAR